MNDINGSGCEAINDKQIATNGARSSDGMTPNPYFKQTPGHIVGFGLLILVFLSCGMPSSTSLPAKSTNDALPFLSLGDSYTIGESVAESDRWSVQLAGLLRSRNVNLQTPTIIAQTGWTTDELLAAIDASGNQQQYDVVSLLIGVNNQYRGKGKEQYRTEFRALLQTAVRYAKNRPSRVVVLSIPDWGSSPFAVNRDRVTIASQIDEFNAVAREECRKAGIAFVDITPITRTATADASQFASDGLHYSGKQMKLWAEKVLPVVEGMLK